MSYDGNGKPGIRGLAQSHESEWDAVRRRPGNKTDCLQREPARGWHRKPVATKAVITIGREAAPTIFWGGKDRQGESRTALIA
jgi:hypothetical protein